MSFSVQDEPKAGIDDLMQVDGKAELVGGRTIRLPPMAHLPGRITGRILFGVLNHVEVKGQGDVYSGTVAYVVPVLPSGRQSFSPDASYYTGRLSDDLLEYILGPPTFAVEVRNKTDYGPIAETAMAAKRADYFAAGTLVVWDVDPVARLVHVYTPADPTRPTTCSGDDQADAEPAVPGWRILVASLFE